MARRGELIVRYTRSLPEERTRYDGTTETVTSVTEYGLREDGAVVRRLKIGDHDYGWSQVKAKAPAKTRAKLLEEREQWLKQLEGKGFTWTRS